MAPVRAAPAAAFFRLSMTLSPVINYSHAYIYNLFGNLLFFLDFAHLRCAAWHPSGDVFVKAYIHIATWRILRALKFATKTALAQCISLISEHFSASTCTHLAPAPRAKPTLTGVWCVSVCCLPASSRDHADEHHAHTE